MVVDGWILYSIRHQFSDRISVIHFVNINEYFSWGLGPIVIKQINMHFDCKFAPISILCFVRWGIQDNERELDRNPNLILKIRRCCIVEEQENIFLILHFYRNNNLFSIVGKRFLLSPLLSWAKSIERVRDKLFIFMCENIFFLRMQT